MLSNAIWIMPTADRSAATGTATVYYRCGSQSGKAATTVSSELSEGEFDDLTIEFILAEIELYRRARISKQKNAARNLKKYFDAGQIATIEHELGERAHTELARTLL
jgi:hypothetical protein